MLEVIMLLRGRRSVETPLMPKHMKAKSEKLEGKCDSKAGADSAKRLACKPKAPMRRLSCDRFLHVMLVADR